MIQETVSDRLANDEFVNAVFTDDIMTDLYKRKIWLALDCPSIDNIGGRIVEDIGLQGRIKTFKKQWLAKVLFENVFKTHQAMLAYGRSSLEFGDF